VWHSEGPSQKQFTRYTVAPPQFLCHSHQYFFSQTALVSSFFFFSLAAVTNCGNSNRKVNSPKNKVISVALPIKPKRMCKNNEKSLKSAQQNGDRDGEKGLEKKNRTKKVK